MNPHASPEEQRILAEAGETPTMLDEKKFLEERRRRLEASLHDHVTEIKDRGEQAGKIALVGAGALVGVWLVAKAIGGLSGGRKRKKARALKSHVKLAALGPGASESAGSRDRAAANQRNRPRPGDEPAPREREQSKRFADEHAAPRREQRQAPRPEPEPAGPSMFQTFMESEAGRMMTNQLVALLMVFVTRKLESVLQIERSADIGSVKESDLTPYRIVDPVSDAKVVTDDGIVMSDDAESARPNAASRPSATT